jgi:hypothetical protein
MGKPSQSPFSKGRGLVWRDMDITFKKVLKRHNQRFLRYYLHLVESVIECHHRLDCATTHPCVPALIRAGNNNERKGIRPSSSRVPTWSFPNYCLPVMITAKTEESYQINPEFADSSLHCMTCTLVFWID